jgi:hypothetical protein
MSKKILLVIIAIFIVLGLNRSNISLPIVNVPSVIPVEELDIPEPSNSTLKTLAENVADKFKQGDDDRKQDGYRLAQLYNDMSKLISLDDKPIIKTTETIKEANVLAAQLLRIDLRGKYPGLAEACDKLVKEHVSGDSVALDKALRNKSVEAFQALAWGCLEGAK